MHQWITLPLIALRRSLAINAVLYFFAPALLQMLINDKGHISKRGKHDEQRRKQGYVQGSKLIVRMLHGYSTPSNRASKARTLGRVKHQQNNRSEQRHNAADYQEGVVQGQDLLLGPPKTNKQHKLDGYKQHPQD